MIWLANFSHYEDVGKTSGLAEYQNYVRYRSMAEEVGVEPTRRFVSTSLVLKTRHPTGDVALP